MKKIVVFIMLLSMAIGISMAQEVICKGKITAVKIEKGPGDHDLHKSKNFETISCNNEMVDFWFRIGTGMEIKKLSLSVLSYEKRVTDRGVMVIYNFRNYGSRHEYHSGVLYYNSDSKWFNFKLISETSEIVFLGEMF